MAAAMALGSCSGHGGAVADTSGADSVAATPATALIERLHAADRSGRVMFGHHDDPVYGHTWSGDSGRSDVLEVTGDYPAVMSWDLGGLELGGPSNLDGVDFDRMRAEVIAQHQRGGINTFSWHLFSPVNGADSWSVGDSATVSLILGDTAVNAAFRRQVTALADFFNSIVTPEGKKVPVIFRPWHEHTGNWFWWGTPYCTPEEYRSLWRLTREVLDSEGADNLVYAYSPDRVDSEEKYMERYPGDSLVDIMGMDVYHFGGEQGADAYRQAAAAELAMVRRLADGHGKVAAFTETGSEGLPMEGWWTDVLLPLLRETPVSYVVVWRNAHDKPGHYYAPFKGDHSAPSFNTFYQDTLTTFIKDVRL